MKAARLVGPKHFEFVDVPQPTPKDGQCLIKLERASVCGSDIRAHYGPILSEEHYPLDPGQPCHEVAGVVVDSRTDSFREGQRVIVIPARGVGGGLQEYMVSGPERMALLPDEGSLDDWVMCQPSGTVLYSCSRMGSVLGKNVLILGQGSIGLCFTMLVSRLGARSVITADLLDYRLDKSREFGATHPINPSQENLSEAVLEITKGVGADVTIEAAGYPETFNLALSQVKQFGTVMVFGVQMDKFIPIEHNYLMDKMPTIIPTTGARSGDPITQIRDMVSLRQRGWCDPAKLITHRMGLSDVQRAYDTYEQYQDGIIKVVMDINR
ncbi:MAG: zinc-binding dehydrogenase [SAR202 cluster bacterium]|nr:zinc-binding dehydrogenase [SAR202 cluster bacterium]